MKYKLIVSDFDGTLATSKDKITPETIKAIKEYQKRGGVFCVSTGRSETSIRPRLSEFDLDANSPLISFQGALITDAISGRIISKTYMDNSLLKDIAVFGEKNNYYFHVYSKENIFAAQRCSKLDMYTRYTKTIDDVIITNKPLSEYLSETKVKKFIKLIFIDTELDMKELENELNRVFEKRVQFTCSADCLVECVDNKAGKGNALKKLADLYGINIAQTIAIGDSMNDCSMLEMAGLGVAVANADERIKKRADLITCSNDENAVAKIIEYALKS